MKKFPVVVALCLFVVAFTPERNKNIIILGDSLSRGYSASSIDAGYVYILADDLGANVAIAPGETVDAAVAKWSNFLWIRNIDYIVIQIIIHDVCCDVVATQEADWQNAYGAMLDKLHADTGAIIITTTSFWYGLTPEIDGERYYKTLRYNEYVRSATKERPFARLADIWSVSFNCADCVSRPGDITPYAGTNWSGDNRHPNNYGHKIIALSIESAIKQHVYYFPLIMKM